MAYPLFSSLFFTWLEYTNPFLSPPFSETASSRVPAFQFFKMLFSPLHATWIIFNQPIFCTRDPSGLIEKCSFFCFMHFHLNLPWTPPPPFSILRWCEQIPFFFFPNHVYVTPFSLLFILLVIWVADRFLLEESKLSPSRSDLIPSPPFRQPPPPFFPVPFSFSINRCWMSLPPFSHLPLPFFLSLILIPFFYFSLCKWCCTTPRLTKKHLSQSSRTVFSPSLFLCLAVFPL